jgi:transketolase
MGAPALDLWRAELPGQVFSAGISEQNAINLASGLSASGKKPYVYFMACWAARCLEQIRYSCAMTENTITILGNGVGLGYAPAGPAHEPTDDLTYMSAIEGLQICSPSSNAHVVDLVKMTLDNPALRYIRFERGTPEILEQKSQVAWQNRLDDACQVLYETTLSSLPLLSIVTSGYLLQRACEVAKSIEALLEFRVAVIDVHTLPIQDTNDVALSLLGRSSSIVTLEEQGPSAGFSGQVLKFMSSNYLFKPTKIITLSKTYIFENGNREQLLDKHNFQLENLIQTVKQFLTEVHKIK